MFLTKVLGTFSGNGPGLSTNAKLSSEPRAATETGDKFRNPEPFDMLILRFGVFGDSNFASEPTRHGCTARTGGFALVDPRATRGSRVCDPSLDYG